MYPVDLPPVDDTDLTLASERYFSSLESRHHKKEEFLSSMATKVSSAPLVPASISVTHPLVCGIKEKLFLFPQTAITVNSVKRLQLFEDGRGDCTLLALHPPDDPTQGSEPDVWSLSDMWKTRTNVLCFTIQFWLYTCMRSGGVWMMY